MKIKALRAKNFAKFTDFELIYNDGVTRLVSLNGGGKTTVGLTLLWAGFKGIAEKSSTNQLIGERFRFIADGAKSLDIEILLHDEITGNDILIKRHITKTLNQLSFKSKDGRALTKDYIENLFNVTFLSASHFTSLTGKEQALALGIDVDEFDRKLVNDKSDASLLRKELKAIGEITRIEKAEKVSVSELLEIRDKQFLDNTRQEGIAKAIKTHSITIEQKQVEIGKLKDDIEGLQGELIALGNPLPLIDLENINSKISNAEQINIQANEYENFIETSGNKQNIEDDLNKNLFSQNIIINDRLKYIKSRSFGMPGLTIDDEGQLVLNDKPIRSPYFSKGELEMIVAQISAGLNPELKVRFIDDFEMLDDANQKKIITKLTEKGFQIITAEVGDEKKGDGTILLRECKIVKEK